MPGSNRLGVFGLFGNIDSGLGGGVVNPAGRAAGGASAGGAQASGRLGQAQSFADSEQARLTRRETARNTAAADAATLQQRIQQESADAENRDRLARSEAREEQEFKLSQLRWETELSQNAQMQAEGIANSRAQAAFQLGEGGGPRPPQHRGQYLYHPEDVQAAFAENAATMSGTGWQGVDSGQLKQGINTYGQASLQRQFDKWQEQDRAMIAGGYTRSLYADGSPRYTFAGGGGIY